MKYQYSDSQQSDPIIKTILIRGFLFLSLLGILYEGYKFFQSSQSKLRRGPDQYCGNHTCYQLLQVQRDATEDQIRKSYRFLARKYHPDKSKEVNAVAVFQTLNKAYQTLIDEKARFIYDLYLNNPDQSSYRRQFQYYNHKYIENPQIPVSYILIGIVIAISSLQYVMRKQMYERAVEQVTNSADFKIKVNQRIKQKGVKKQDKQSIREQMIEQIQIQGGYAKPTYKDIFGYKLIIFPWTFLLWVKNNLIWIGKYYILRKDYDKDAQIYLTKKSLTITQRQWENLAEDQKQNMLSKSLWIEQNKKLFIKQKRQQWLEQMRLNNPAKYSMMMKYLTRNGIKLD